MKVEIKYLHNQVEEGLELKRAHVYDAGLDVPMYKDITIKHGKNVIPLGFTMVLPAGQMAFLSPRSSVMGDGIVYNMTPIDTDYSGEWNMIIYNIGEEVIIKKGERIGQVVVTPVTYIDPVESLGKRRESNGVGSTGK